MRSLDWLLGRAIVPLSKFSRPLRMQCISIAKTANSPTAAGHFSFNAAVMAGLDQSQASIIGRATRFLAMIKRDYGQEVFVDAAGKLL
jgi:hypothetical protein